MDREIQAMTGRKPDPEPALDKVDFSRLDAVGAIKTAYNHNDRARQVYQQMDAMLYGEGGHSAVSSELGDKALAAPAGDIKKVSRDDLDNALNQKRDALNYNDLADASYRRKQEDEPLNRKRESFDHNEWSEAKYQRMSRSAGAEKWEANTRDDERDDDPDRQQEALGGGRTRSR